MTQKKILIVEDMESERQLLEFHLKEWGYTPLIAKNGNEALEILKKNHVTMILSDLIMPLMDGLQLLNEVRNAGYGDTPFIMMSVHGKVDKAVASIKQGADNYILKPIKFEELHSTIKKYYLIDGNLPEVYKFQNLSTKSPLMVRALQLAEYVSNTEHQRTNVAIYGETGTGKDVLAKEIHRATVQNDDNFVDVNCAAIPSALLESQLFGHKKGSFSSADRDCQGKFDFAQQGTMLLDEIGDMPLDLQAKLLRVLEENVYEMIGSNEKIKADFRFIVTTHRDLKSMVGKEQFRGDLYHRINSFPIHLPPLRKRKEDIPLLIEHFLWMNRNKIRNQIPVISHEAKYVLSSYNWPGNIRELKNCIDRSVILANKETIKLKHLNIKSTSSQSTNIYDEDIVSMNIDLDRDEFSLNAAIECILGEALKRSKNNITQAAELLKVDRKMFYRRNYKKGKMYEK